MKCSVVFRIGIVLLLFVFQLSCSAQESNIKLGAYYFDGWTGNNEYQLNPILKSSFVERKPIWGWITSTQDVIDKQVALASNYNIDYFTFCWYGSVLNDKIQEDDKNRALGLFLNSENRKLIDFNVLVANHDPYDITPDNWETLATYWVELFKEDGYLKINGAPVISFLSLNSLLKEFRTTKDLKKALSQLRQIAKNNGIDSVMIGACVKTNWTSINNAEMSGFDFTTSYNFHRTGFSKSLEEVKDISAMHKAEIKAWTYISKNRKLPIQPTITLNWHTRPLDSLKRYRSSIYTGFSKKSVKQSVLGLRKWLQSNSLNVIGQRNKYIMIYAWNEYGEGAWLTPSKVLRTSLLDGLKEGLETPIE